MQALVSQSLLLLKVELEKGKEKEASLLKTGQEHSILIGIHEEE